MYKLAVSEQSIMPRSCGLYARCICTIMQKKIEADKGPEQICKNVFMVWYLGCTVTLLICFTVV